MASSPQITVQGLPATPSTREERSAALEELLSMYGMLHDLYAKVGGAEEWHREEQAAWNESALA